MKYFAISHAEKESLQASLIALFLLLFFMVLGYAARDHAVASQTLFNL